MDGDGSGLYAVGGRRSCAFVVSAVPTAKSPWSSFFLGMVIVIACRVGGSLCGGGKYPLGGRASGEICGRRDRESNLIVFNSLTDWGGQLGCHREVKEGYTTTTRCEA